MKRTVTYKVLRHLRRARNRKQELGRLAVRRRRLLTIRQFSAIMGISIPTVRYWLTRGLPSEKVAGQLFFRASVLKGWVQTYLINRYRRRQA
jgi:hypothetical protein